MAKVIIIIIKAFDDRNARAIGLFFADEARSFHSVCKKRIWWNPIDTKDYCK